MLGIPKEELTANLVNLQKSQCAYIGEYCDCKYMPPDIEQRHLRKNTESWNGCPEISMAHRLIKAMTSDEFNTLCKKAGILI